jgi:pterin-4a-carbinolamine dehydratase
MDQMEKVQQPSEVLGDAPVRMELKPERIQLLLQRVPEWRLREDGLGIERVRPVADPGRAREVVEQICRVASALRQPVSIAVDSKQVIVTLKGHPVRGCTGGLTEPVFKLAEALG